MDCLTFFPPRVLGSTHVPATRANPALPYLHNMFPTGLQFPQSVGVSDSSSVSSQLQILEQRDRHHGPLPRRASRFNWTYKLTFLEQLWLRWYDYWKLIHYSSLWVLILVLSLSSCVTLDKLLNLSVLQLSHLRVEDNHSIYLIELL